MHCSVYTAAFQPGNAGLLLSCGGDGAVRLWDLAAARAEQARQGCGEYLLYLPHLLLYHVKSGAPRHEATVIVLGKERNREKTG